ncbi:hypothetical protein [Sphingomonas trueperi]|uniref:hypothetical protein n=1 Tax=Sphingomonas trueperi TaxID=53317 RepID=UPI000EB04B83
MIVAAKRAYWREAVEFLVYFVFMTLLSAAMFVLVSYAPQANSTWYINTCIAVAVLTGGYAVRMYRRHRAAGLSNSVGTAKTTPTRISPKESRRRSWSDRIAGETLRNDNPERAKALTELEAVEEAYRARCRARGEKPDRSSSEPTASMTTDQIRKRIALRLDQLALHGARGPASGR